MRFALQDHFAAAPILLADHAEGSAIVAMPDGGVMQISMAPPSVTLTPPWTLSGGVWNDAAPWSDAALWEDN